MTLKSLHLLGATAMIAALSACGGAVADSSQAEAATTEDSEDSKMSEVVAELVSENGFTESQLVSSDIAFFSSDVDVQGDNQFSGTITFDKDGTKVTLVCEGELSVGAPNGMGTWINSFSCQEKASRLLDEVR